MSLQALSKKVGKGDLRNFNRPHTCDIKEGWGMALSFASPWRMSSTQMNSTKENKTHNAQLHNGKVHGNITTHVKGKIQIALASYLLTLTLCATLGCLHKHLHVAEVEYQASKRRNIYGHTKTMITCNKSHLHFASLAHHLPRKPCLGRVTRHR